MQDIELIQSIALIALYIALIALVIYLIIAIRRIVSAVDNINGAVDKMEKTVDHFVTKSEPLIENSLVITGDFKDISGILKQQTAKVEGIVDSVKDTTDSIIEFEQKVQKEVETNVFDTLNMIAAVSRGLKTFLGALSGSHNGSGSRKKLRRESSIEKDEDLY
jgi:uncharacterized protein YoxC